MVEVARVMQSAAAVALQPRTIIMPPTVSIDSRLECGSDGAVALGRDRSSTRGADKYIPILVILPCENPISARGLFIFCYLW